MLCAVGSYQRQEPEKMGIRDLPSDLNDSLWSVIIAGPLKNAKQLDVIAVESKLGKLWCAGLSGTTQEGKKTVVSIQSRLHKERPSAWSAAAG